MPGSYVPKLPYRNLWTSILVGHVLDKNTREHLPYISVVLKGTTIGVMTDASGHYFLKNLPEGDFFLETSSVGYKTERRKVSLRRGTTLEIDFEIEEDAVVLDRGCRFCPIVVKPHAN